MELLEAITTRASIRKYTDQPLTEQEINTLLLAGFCAPSAMNRRPWHFLVVRDRTLLQQIGESSTYGKMIPKAAACIVACGDKERTTFPELLTDDCAAAIQNILLAAHGIGLGAVWCGLVKGQEFYESVKELFQLPTQIEPEGLIAIGHPAETKEHPESFEPDKIHYDQW